MMVRVGIVGCGTIGAALAHALERDYTKGARIVALADRVRAQALRLQQQLSSHPPIVSLRELIRRSQLVIEAASVSLAARAARLALASHRDVLIMSTGGLLADWDAWQRVATRSRGHLYVPSGALCGLDGVKAFAVGTIKRIRLTTRKPPAALAAAPFVKARRLNLTRLRRPKVLFEGSPTDAIRGFPQNTNVAATMALACLANGRSSLRHPALSRKGGVKPMVRVVADPTIRVNMHELEVEGDCGRIGLQVASRPSARNPKTSELAIRSALATLRQLFSPVRIGT